MEEFYEAYGKKGGKAQGDEPFYWFRQYVFAGATVPDTGAKGVMAALLDRHPDLIFIEGDQLHRTKREIEYRFREVAPDNRLLALAETITKDEDFTRRRQGRMLVFCENQATAEEAHAFLRRRGVNVCLFHM